MPTRIVLAIIIFITLCITFSPNPVFAAAPVIETSSSTGTISGNGTTLSVALPSGVASGDLLVACLAAAGDDTADMSATGWTHVETAGGGGTTTKVGLMYRFWQSGDSTPVVFTISSSNSLALRRGVMWRISGADATPSDAVASTNVSGTSTSRVYNSITTNTNEALVLGCLSWNSNDSTYTPDASLSNTVTQNRNAADSYVKTTAGATGAFTGSGSSTQYASLLWAVAPGESIVNNAPTIALNSPSDAGTGVSTTPTLTFTGSDADDDDLTYEIQVTDNPDGFTGGEVLTDSFSAGGGGSFHPQPHSSAVTWQSNIQVDDRMCQSFTAGGGKWAKAVFPLGDSRVDTSGTSYARIYTHAGTFGTSSAPANAGAPLNQTSSGTPTRDWLAVSDSVSLGASFASGDFDFNASGANQIRFSAGERYMLCSDWIPNNNTTNNTWAWSGDVLNSGTLHSGNLYNDGYLDTNAGPQATWDLHFKMYETFTLEDTNSTDDPGFSNTVSGGDTTPFTEGQAIGYEVQTTLDEDITYYWRVRVNDGTVNSSWSSTQSFTTSASATPTPTPTSTSSSATSSSSSTGQYSESCGNTIPSTEPRIFQIETTSTSAKIYVHPAGGSITGYSVIFGYSPGDDRFSSSFNQGFSSGLVTHTINHLQSDTRYYFRIMAHNGCATTSSSSYASATTTLFPFTKSITLLSEARVRQDTPKPTVLHLNDEGQASKTTKIVESSIIEKSIDFMKAIPNSVWQQLTQISTKIFNILKSAMLP